MMFVDAHIHLSDQRYGEEIDEIISEAKEVGVIALLSNSTDYKTSLRNIELAKIYPRIVYIALGIHPMHAGDMTEEEVKQVSKLILEHEENESLVAIGEIGLDRKYPENLNKQIVVVKEMLNLAEKMDLPAIIHSRNAISEVFDVLSSYDVERVMLHWFNGSGSMVSEALERGYYISEGVPATYSKSIRKVVSQLPLKNLLTETDGPVRFYKHPYKGKRTTPAFIPSVVKAIAEVKNLEELEISARLVDNFETFFRVKLN